MIGAASSIANRNEIYESGVLETKYFIVLHDLYADLVNDCLIGSDGFCINISKQSIIDCTFLKFWRKANGSILDMTSDSGQKMKLSIAFAIDLKFLEKIMAVYRPEISK